MPDTDNRIRFSTLDSDGVESSVRYIKQGDMMKCPHFIMDPQHYRLDGSCKCNDASETIMAEWGYTWDKTTNQWS